MQRLKYYALDSEHHAFEVSMETWAKSMQDASRHVVQTELEMGTYVSTVFLGMDHRISGKGPPLLFETLVFGGPMADEMSRYSSWDDAVIGHAVMVRRCKDAIRKSSRKVQPRELDM